MSDHPAIDSLNTDQPLPSAGQTSEAISAERVDQILDDRARVLAARQEGVARKTVRKTLLLMYVGSHVAGIELEWVREVANLPHAPAPVPDAHPSLLGVINLHNQLVNLFSPWPLLNDSGTGPVEGFAQAVLLRHSDLQVAIACDHVGDLVEVADEDWQSERLFLFGGARQPGVLLTARSLLNALIQQQQSGL